MRNGRWGLGAKAQVALADITPAPWSLRPLPFHPIRFVSQLRTIDLPDGESVYYDINHRGMFMLVLIAAPAIV